MKIASSAIAAALTLAFLGTSIRPASAALTLTAAGVARGFGLSLADQFPNTGPGGIGPLGIEFTPSGGVLVTDFFGNVRVMPDIDGQHAPDYPPAAGAVYAIRDAVDLARVGASFYMTQLDSDRVVQINADGTFNQLIVSGIWDALGLAANPVNGHLFVSQSDIGLGANIYEVDPIAKTFSLFNSEPTDGMIVSPDGTTLYTASAPGNVSHVLGFDILTKALVFDSGALPGFVDGLALGTGVLAGNIYGNNNDGTVVEINLLTSAQTIIASGGTRGDFVKVDPNNGTLLMTQSDDIWRLTAPAGGGFAGAVVPEPSTFVMFGVGCIFLIGSVRRRIGKVASPI